MNLDKLCILFIWTFGALPLATPLGERFPDSLRLDPNARYGGEDGGDNVTWEGGETSEIHERCLESKCRGVTIVFDE